MQTETLLEAACSSMPSILHSGQESIVDVVSHFGKTCQEHSVPTKAQTLHKWLASWQDLTTLLPPPNGWGSEGAAVGDAGMLEWAVLDAQFHGLAQRRKRVFAIVDFGDWESRQPILLERESLRGDTPPSRETRQEITGTTEIGTGSCSCSHIDIVAGTQSARMVAFGEYSEDGSASTLKMRDYKDATDLVYALAGNTIGRKPENGGNGNGFDDSGVSYTLTKTDLHGVCFTQNTRDEVRYINGDGGIAGALAASSGMKQTNYIALIDKEQNGAEEPPAVAYSFDSLSSNSMKSANPHSGCNAVDISKCLDTSCLNPSCNQGGIAVIGALCARDYKGVGNQYIQENKCVVDAFDPVNIKSQVRRLTPIECARLQGFKDNYLDIEFKGKPAADSHKYKALGNSMAVPVMRYIGLRVLAAMKTEQGGFTQ